MGENLLYGDFELTLVLIAPVVAPFSFAIPGVGYPSSTPKSRTVSS